MMASFKRAIAVIVSTLSGLGVVALFLFYDRIIKYVSIPIFYVLLLMLLLLLSSILVFRRPVDANIEKSNLFAPNTWIYILVIFLIGVYCFSLLYDITVGAMFYSTIVLMPGLFVSLLLSKKSYRLSLFCILFIFLSYIIVIYAFYPPSLGIDTWRDCYVASKIKYTGGIDVISLNYELPVVSVMYAVVSLVLNISCIYASAILGILFILIAALFAFLISDKLSKKSNHSSSLITVILILSIPLISLWGVWFIPEAYALLMFLSLLLTIFISSSVCKTDFILMVFPILIAMVLSHGGFDLWSIGFLASLLMAKYVLKAKSSDYVSLKSALWILMLVTLCYFAYTAMMSAITGGVNGVLQVLFAFTTSTGSARTNFVSSESSAIATGLLSYGSMAVCAVAAFIAWLGNKPAKQDFRSIFLETSFIYSTAMLIVALLGLLYYPEASLERYLGLGALMLLSISASSGFRKFLKRGLVGKIFAGFLLLLLLASIGFGAVMTPDFNPLTTKNIYSVESPITWADRTSINVLVMNMNNDGLILSDWRTSLPMVDLFIDRCGGSVNLNGLADSFELHSSQGSIRVITLGSFGSYENFTSISDYLDKGGIFVYRSGALEDLNILKGISEQQLHEELLLNHNKVYSSSIEVIT